jgi:hypothetical protein
MDCGIVDMLLLLLNLYKVMGLYRVEILCSPFYVSPYRHVSAGASRPALGPTQPPSQGALSLGVKRPGREGDHSPPSSAEFKECVELYLHSPNTLSFFLQYQTKTEYLIKNWSVM